METDSKYVERTSEKYNRRRVIAFVQKKAEKRFLSPLGLNLRSFPPEQFGNNRNRLTRDEEFELFAALHYMKYKVAKAKTSKCCSRYLEIYLALRNRGISANYPLVLDCVKRHSQRLNRSLDKAHLIERGYLSLINAVDGFDPWMGYRFSTYACNAITRSFYNRTQVMRNFIPLDEVNDDEIGSELPDDTELWLERLDRALQSNSLTLKEKEVLRLRFHEKLTLKEVGNLWELTKERVRQIQIEAFNKLRRQLSKDPILS